jgi:ubiquinone/menaquinone biosynthesis C-methylase UbiE
MSKSEKESAKFSPDILSYYQRGGEAERLFSGIGQLELARTQELTLRYLPPPPAKVLDVGGGSGVYACWLSRLGYEVHLVDPAPLHLEQAQQASAAQPDHPIAQIVLGDARQLDYPDESTDAVLLLGPLYHLTERDDRLAAFHEARRVLRPRGIVLAVGISRFASTMAGLFEGALEDPDFVRIVKQDLVDGQHRNPTDKSYFTTAFFHHPDELKIEVQEAGLRYEKTLAIESIASVLSDFEMRWEDPKKRQLIMGVVGWLEEEPSLLGATAHLMAIAYKED